MSIARYNRKLRTKVEIKTIAQRCIRSLSKELDSIEHEIVRLRIAIQVLQTTNAKEST